MSTRLFSTYGPELLQKSIKITGEDIKNITSGVSNQQKVRYNKHKTVNVSLTMSEEFAASIGKRACIAIFIMVQANLLTVDEMTCLKESFGRDMGQAFDSVIINRCYVVGGLVQPRVDLKAYRVYEYSRMGSIIGILSNCYSLCP